MQAVRGRDRRNATFRWQAVPGAYGYQIYYGIAPDKLFNTIFVTDATSYHFRGLNRDVGYFCQMEALGETGCRRRARWWR